MLSSNDLQTIPVTGFRRSRRFRGKRLASANDLVREILRQEVPLRGASPVMLLDADGREVPITELRIRRLSNGETYFVLNGDPR